MVDFTLLVFLRGPNDMGGFWFLVTSLLSMVGSGASVFLYSNHYDGEDKLGTETLQKILGSLIAIWLVSALSFVAVMDRKYLHTFISKYLTAQSSPVIVSLHLLSFPSLYTLNTLSFVISD